MQKKLQTNTAEEILSTVYKPIEYVIDGLLAQGLYILAGSQKIGKSWLALDICHSIATGSDVLKRKTVQGKKEIYTIQEIEQIFKALENESLKYRLYIMLAVYSGFRRSEMLGLEWKDIDFTNNIITVKRTSQYTKAKGIYTDTTKIKRSKRTIKFPQLIMDLLKDFRIEQLGEAERIGSKWIDNDRLFAKWNGEPMNPQTPYGWFREFCKHNGFRFCDIHSLRHFYASALINEGVDAATVSGALGHSTITTTTSIYCHVFNQAQARAGDAIASVLDFKKYDTDKGQPEAV